jgi:hypothetical protein
MTERIEGIEGIEGIDEHGPLVTSPTEEGT